MYSDELYKKYPSDFFDLIIIDECHRSGFGTWNEILQYFDSAVQLGMTATPKRDDNIDTYAYFGEPVYSYSMGNGIEDGFLAPYQIFRYATNIDKQGLKVDEAKRQGAKIFIPEGASLKDLYTFGEFEREIVLPDRTAKICEHLAEVLRTLGPKDRTIVFCVNMEHAALVAKELQKRFSWLGLPDYAVRIVSEEPYSDALFREFKDSEKETPVIATTVDLLTTGVDVPSVRNVVFLKPMSSKVYFKQHIGRGCRIDPLTNKYIFRIIDYVNATRLLDDWDMPSGKPLPEGPFDLAITGYVVNPDQRPISGVRVVAQIGPNLQQAAVTKEDGSFELEGLPHSPVELRLSKAGFRQRQVKVTPPDEVTIELMPDIPTTHKIEVEGIEVYIAEETKIVLTSSGKTLTESEYIEYAKEGVVERVATLDDLYQVWTDSSTRDAFLKDLREHSIYPNLLASLFKKPDADTFDVLAHLAFGAPLLTRDERANAFLNKRSEFLRALGADAQEVLLSLLDKYRMGGVEQIKPAVFNIPPFDKFGYIRGVAEMFGGIDKLKEAIEQLQKGLYGGSV